MANAGDIRYRLVQQLLRDGAKRGAARFHVACADADGNVELFMQAGFVRYGEEMILAPAGGPCRCPSRGPTRRRATARIRPATQLDALPLSRLYAAVTPAPGRAPRGDPARRLGAPGHALAGAALQPRADPALRRRRGVRPGGAGRRQGRDRARRLRPGRRGQGGPAALPQGPGPPGGRRGAARRLRARRHRGPDGARADHRHDHGVIAPVRTYESPHRSSTGGGGLRHRSPPSRC